MVPAEVDDEAVDAVPFVWPSSLRICVNADPRDPPLVEAPVELYPDALDCVGIRLATEPVWLAVVNFAARLVRCAACLPEDDEANWVNCEAN